MDASTQGCSPCQESQGKVRKYAFPWEVQGKVGELDKKSVKFGKLFLEHEIVEKYSYFDRSKRFLIFRAQIPERK